MIKDFFSKLGANAKITVGVSISPGIGLEMIELDRATKTVVKYGCKPLDYNYSTREIVDYAQFQESLNDLFDELHISKKSNVILTVPNVQFGIMNLPLLLMDDAVTNAIISEVEQSYIFKRQEPIVSWVELGSNMDTENRSLAYTALQQVAVDGLKAACQEVGCTLVSIETSYASFFKTLHYTELAKEQMKDNTTWNLMIVGQNNYSIFSMSGKRMIEYYEEPLALKSFVDDEIYNAITSSAQLTLSALPVNYLFIASETDLVSAEVLSMKLPFEGTVKFLECNKYTQDELIPVNLNILPNLALKITPEVIGSAIYSFCEFPVRFNLTGQKDRDASSLDEDEVESYPIINIGNLEVELTPGFLKKISLIICSAIAVPALILFFTLNYFLDKEQTKLNDINAKIAQDNQEIAKYESNNSGGFNLNEAISKITSQNRTKLLYYDAMGLSVPNKLWVNYYSTNSAEGVDIKGKATDVASIYAFYKSIKQLVNNSNIKIYKLEMASGSIDDVIGNSSGGPKYYEFEITNMTESELNPPAAGATATTAGAPNSATAAQPAGQPAPPAPAPPQPAQPAPPANGAVQNTPKQQPFTPIAPPKGSDQLPKNLEKIEKF